MPSGDFLSVPCTYPDLRDDRLLKGAIRFAVEKQLRSLDTQCEQGTFVYRLIAFAELLLLRVRDVSALARRGRLFHCSELPKRSRRTQVWLTAIPMSAATDRIAAPLSENFARPGPSNDIVRGHAGQPQLGSFRRPCQVNCRSF